MADTTGLGALNKDTIAAVAADSTSDDLLNLMKQKAAELNSPWHKFQSDLDLMVARSHYNPESAIASVKQQRNLEDAQIQNIYSNMANIGMLRNQLGGMRDTLQGLQGKPQSVQGGQAPATSAQQDPNSDLTPLQLNALSVYAKNNDISGFQTKLAEFANTNAKAKLESQYSWSRFDILENVPILAPDGKVYHVSTTKEELDKYKKNPLDLPIALGGRVNPEYPGPKAQSELQKKANGGIMRHMANGSLTAPADSPSAPVANPMAQDTGMQGGMVDTILSSLMGSAQAAEPQGSVTVQGWKPPAVSNAPNYGFQKQEQQSGLQQQQQTNEAQLKSLIQEREAAGKFIADLQNQSFDPTTSSKAQEIIEMASKYPKYFGYGMRNDHIGILMGLTVSTEDSKEVGDQSKNISRLADINARFQGEDALEKRSRLNQLARELGIAYEKEQFGGTGSKMGAQLTTISQAAKGLGANFPASQNLKQALTIQLVHERNKEIAKEWRKYSETVKNADPYAFMVTPKIQAIMGNWDLQLKKAIRQVDNQPKEGDTDTDAKGNNIVFKNGQWMRAKQ